jgi:hypothetical protein
MDEVIDSMIIHFGGNSGYASTNEGEFRSLKVNEWGK